MRILPPMTSSAAHGPGSSIFGATKNTITDMLGGVTEDKIQIDLTGPDYTSIDERTAGRMVGFFTQKMKDMGFPWHLRRGEAVDGQLKMRELVSELEAVDRLKKGEPVFLQPMRNLNLDISGDSLGALAAAGSLGGSASLDGVGKVAAFSKTAKMGSNNGIELRYGAPIPVSTFGELKLVYQMYNPEEKVGDDASALGKAAHQLSSFTTKRMGSSYPWRFYKEASNNTALRVTKASAKAFTNGALVGVSLGAMIGGPIGIFTGNWSVLKVLATYGAMLGGGYAAIDAGRVAAKGEAINVVEALERISQGQDVVLQETKMRSVSVPFLGNVAWFTDHGKGSPIDSVEKLDRFYWMINQDAKPEEKKEEPKPPDPSKQVNLYVAPGGHVHLQVGDRLQLGDQLQLGDRIKIEEHEHEHFHLGQARARREP